RSHQLRLRRRHGRREQAHGRVRDRAQRPEPAPRVTYKTFARGNPRAKRPRGSTMPQEAWSAKRERQYEHIEESLEERGTPKKRAKEISARTVNKERARTGEARESPRLSRKDLSSGRRGGKRSGTNRPKGRTR